MKVALISPEYPPMTNWGGVATYNAAITKLLAQHHEVHVFTLGEKRSDKALSETLIVHYVPRRFSKKTVNWLYFIFPGGIFRRVFQKIGARWWFNVEWNLFVLGVFAGWQKKIHFDVIHAPTYDFPILLIGLVYSDIPKILHVHGMQQDFNRYDLGGNDYQLCAQWERWMLCHVSGEIVCGSALLKDQLGRVLLNKRKVWVIPNVCPDITGSGNGQINIMNWVYFGRLEYRKGVDLLVRLFSTLAQEQPRLKLYLIGEEGMIKNDKQRYVYFSEWLANQKLDARVRKNIFQYPHIRDSKSLAELLLMLRGVAWFPSRYEPFGYAIVEAMNLGFIVVASKQAGVMEYLVNRESVAMAAPTVKSMMSCWQQIENMKAGEMLNMASKSRLEAERLVGMTNRIEKWTELYQCIGLDVR